MRAVKAGARGIWYASLIIQGWWMVATGVDYGWLLAATALIWSGAAAPSPWSAAAVKRKAVKDAKAIGRLVLHGLTELAFFGALSGLVWTWRAVFGGAG